MATIKYNEKVYRVMGSPLKKESPAPAFELTSPSLESITLESYNSNAKIIVTLPTIDTNTSEQFLASFDGFAKRHPEITCIVITNDTPFALSLKNNKQTNLHFLFNDRQTNFQKDYGIGIDEGPLKGLLAKSACVLDKQDYVRFNEYVENMDYSFDTDKLFKEALALLSE